MNAVKYNATVEVDITQLASTMSHEEAAQAIMEIDDYVADLDFTIDIAKRLIDTVFEEGLNSYIDKLVDHVEAKAKEQA